MGAGGRQNYAQAAMQTLFGEQLRQLENQAAQPAEVNEELVEQYTPQSTPVGETTEDVTRRFTEGTGAGPTSQSAGLQGILDKIAAENVSLNALAPAKNPGSIVTPFVKRFLKLLAILTKAFAVANCLGLIEFNVVYKKGLSTSYIVFSISPALFFLNTTN